MAAERGSEFGSIFFLLVLAACGVLENDEPGVAHPAPVPNAAFDYPVWHPDGRWIAAHHEDSVDVDEDGVPDALFGGIWLVDSGSGAKQPLVNGFQFPAWSPDGRMLAMGRGGHIYTVRVVRLEPAQIDTAGITQLTSRGRNFFPAWSQDGEWIAYDSDAADESAPYSLWRMQRDGSMQERLTAESTRMPHWSPDGSAIVHKLYVNDYGEIGVVAASGGSPERLTFDDHRSDIPRFSPDGSRIAYRSQPLKGWPAVWTMNPDGTDQRKITPDFSWTFDWSPDGRELVFLFLNVQKKRPGNGHLWTIKTDGTGLRQLTRSD